MTGPHQKRQNGLRDRPSEVAVPFHTLITSLLGGAGGCCEDAATHLPLCVFSGLEVACLERVSYFLWRKVWEFFFLPLVVCVCVCVFVFPLCVLFVYMMYIFYFVYLCMYVCMYVFISLFLYVCISFLLYFFFPLCF